MRVDGIASDLIYDIKGIADILGISDVTVRKLTKTGEIPYFKIGNRYRFCGWQIKDWLNKKQKESKK